MSRLKAYSVFDLKAEAFLRPFFAATRGLAVRSFSDAVNDSKHEFFVHITDYQLFELGEWDERTGLFVSKIELLGGAVNFKTEVIE